MRNLIGHVLQPRFLSDEIRLVQLARLVHKAKGCADCDGSCCETFANVTLVVLILDKTGRHEQMVCISYLPCTSAHLVFNHSNRSPRMFETWTCDRLQRKPHSRSWWRMGELHVSSMLLWLVELYRAWLLASDKLLDALKWIARDNSHT